MNDYKTVLIEDTKGRVTIPAQVRNLINESERTAYQLIYNSVSNEITLKPITMEKE